MASHRRAFHHNSCQEGAFVPSKPGLKILYKEFSTERLGRVKATDIFFRMITLFIQLAGSSNGPTQILYRAVTGTKFVHGRLLHKHIQDAAYKIPPARFSSRPGVYKGCSDRKIYFFFTSSIIEYLQTLTVNC